MSVPPHVPVEAPLDRLPVLGISGYRESGKTTLIEALIPVLRAQGLRVAVIKHDAHGLDVDRAGKDSDRFYRAGATVAVQGPGETFVRHPAAAAPTFGELVLGWTRRHDLVLVEGHKHMPLPVRIWLERSADDAPPVDVGRMTLHLGPSENRVEAAKRLIAEWLPKQGKRTPIRAGVLIGGRSSRMGRPKHLLKRDGVTWLERIVRAATPCVEQVVLLGNGAVPKSLADLERVPDAPGRAGPIAGIVSAMRWSPWSSWVFLPCDVPDASTDAIRWLLDQREPGRWGVFPVEPENRRVHPIFAWHDYRLGDALSTVDRPIALADTTVVHQAVIPPALASAWANVNVPARRRATRAQGAGAER